MYVLQKWTTNSIKTNLKKKFIFTHQEKSFNLSQCLTFSTFLEILSNFKNLFHNFIWTTSESCILLQNKAIDFFDFGSHFLRLCRGGHAAAFPVNAAALEMNAAMVASQWHRTWTSSLHSPISANHEAGQAASPPFPSLRYDPTGDRPSLL